MASTRRAMLSMVFLFVALRSACAQVPTATGRPAHGPWNLEALAKPPEFEWLEKDAPVRALLYRGESYQGHPTHVFAYYATPASLNGESPQDRKWPAIVLLHGGGGTAFREWCQLWAKRGYAAIAMDLAGQRPIEGKNPHLPANRTRLSDGGPDQSDREKFGHIDRPVGDQWPYHAVADALLAHSLIRSFPEVDAARTAVTGISWGGYLTCIVAGVDHRFQCAVPVYGCGFLYEDSAWTNRLAKMSVAQRQRWIDLWDPSRYLPAVSRPILFVNGTNDFAYPLDSYMKSYDAVPGPKQLRITVNMPHGHPPGWAPIEIGLFVDHILRGGPGLPTVDDPHVVGGKVHVRFKSPSKIKLGALHFTTDHGPFNKRSWHDAAATIERGGLTAAAPPADATAWFLTITDERGATVSTRVVFYPPATSRK